MAVFTACKSWTLGCLSSPPACVIHQWCLGTLQQGNCYWSLHDWLLPVLQHTPPCMHRDWRMHTLLSVIALLMCCNFSPSILTENDCYCWTFFLHLLQPMFFYRSTFCVSCRSILTEIEVSSSQNNKRYKLVVVINWMAWVSFRILDSVKRWLHNMYMTAPISWSSCLCSGLGTASVLILPWRQHFLHGHQVPAGARPAVQKGRLMSHVHTNHILSWSSTTLVGPYEQVQKGRRRENWFFCKKKNERRLLPNLCFFGEKSWLLLRLSVVPFYWVQSDLDLVSEGIAHFLPKLPAAPSLEPSNNHRCPPALPSVPWACCDCHVLLPPSGSGKPGEDHSGVEHWQHMLEAVPNLLQSMVCGADFCLSDRRWFQAGQEAGTLCLGEGSQ